VGVLKASVSEAEQKTFDAPEDNTLQEMCKKRIKTTQLKLTQLEMELETMTKSLETFTLFLKTAGVWLTKPLPPDSEIAQMKMQILQRKAQQKWKDLNLQIHQHQIINAG
jgi:hypothetical protein